MDKHHSQHKPPANSHVHNCLEIITRLKTIYPQVKGRLFWQTPWELLVATILAAQCTDIRVNQVTPIFFKNWPDVFKLAQTGRGRKSHSINRILSQQGQTSYCSSPKDCQ